MIRRPLAAVAAAAVAVALLASCSSAPQSPPPAPSTATTPPATATTPAAMPAAMPAATPTPVRVVAAVNPCAGNRANQAVRVRLKVQHLWMCEKTTLVRDTPITSGIPGEYTSTPTGRYEIQARTRDTSLTLIDGQTYAVKYWIPFDGPLFGFHDSSWQTIPYGSPQYRRDGSHGCIHMPLAAIRFLYRWADVGASVRITA